MVKHVPRVAQFLVWQGVFDCLTALCFALMLTIPRESWREQLSLIPCFGFVVAPALLLAGIIKIIAGRRNAHWQGRGLGLVALGSCFVSLFTCYCAPTALALLVYGFMVYMNPSVRRAFRTGGVPAA